MQNEPNEFERLSKLLALKRHEQPPPRYFLDFSDRVLARLQVPEAEETISWWQWLSLNFELKPVLVCAMGVLLSAAFVAGITLSLNLQHTTNLAAKQPSRPVTANAYELAAATPSGTSFGVPASNLQTIDRPEEIPPSTDPVAGTAVTRAASPFNQLALCVSHASWSADY